MSIQLISYDISEKSNVDHDRLRNEIKKYNHYHLQYSFWAISTTQSHKEVRDHLLKFIDKNKDKLFVNELGIGVSAWHNEGDFLEWLKTARS